MGDPSQCAVPALLFLLGVVAYHSGDKNMAHVTGWAIFAFPLIVGALHCLTEWLDYKCFEDGKGRNSLLVLSAGLVAVVVALWLWLV